MVGVPSAPLVSLVSEKENVNKQFGSEVFPSRWATARQECPRCTMAAGHGRLPHGEECRAHSRRLSFDYVCVGVQTLAQGRSEVLGHLGGGWKTRRILLHLTLCTRVWLLNLRGPLAVLCSCFLEGLVGFRTPGQLLCALLIEQDPESERVTFSPFLLGTYCGCRAAGMEATQCCVEPRGS